jgi:hypothetical protein
MADDAYEREYMAGKGAVLHRQKVQAPRWALALTAGLPLILASGFSAWLGMHGAPAFDALLPLLGGATYAAMMAGVFVVFAGGRIAVSEGELHVQIGPVGPRVAIEDIESCELGASGLRNYGLGAKKLLDGTTVLSMLGDNAKSVRIQRRNASPLVIVCPDAEGVVRAITEARSRLARSTPKTRVEVPEESALEEEAPAAESTRSSEL